MNAPWNQSRRGGGPREPFTAFVCDDETVEAIRPIVNEIGWAADKINKGGLRHAIETLSVSSSPSVLLVDLSESGDPLNDINALAEVCEPGTIVIATGRVNDVRLYRDLMSSGIQDYLLKPVNPDTLREAFLGAQAALTAPPRAHDADTDQPRLAIAVIGVRGGAGSSTVASSLAWILAERAERSTALLDLDVHFGTGAMAFDLEPGRGLTDALENPSRIDGLFIERALVRVSERLAVLSAEAPMSQPLMADGAALFQLQEEMRSAFDCLVVDLPRSMAVQHPHLLAEIQAVVVVTDLSLAGTRDTIRLLSWLRSNAPGAKVMIVVNRMFTTTAPEVTRKDFEASIERNVDFIIPYDIKTAVAAAKNGKCLAEAAGSNKVAAPLAGLARALIDGAVSDDDGTAKSLLGNLKSLLATKGKLARAS